MTRIRPLAHSKRARRTDGAALVEGAVGLTLILTGAISAIFLLLDIATVLYYKEKLGFVATQTAETISKEYIGWNGSFTKTPDPGQEARSIVSALLQQFNLPAAKSVVAQVANQTVTVTITSGDLALFGTGTILPINTQLEETGASAMCFEQPPGLFTLSPDGVNMVTMPTYGKFIVPFSNGAALPDGAPPGTAVFENFNFPYSQFNITFPPGGQYSETLETP